MRISAKELQYIADLSKLTLDEATKERLIHDLNEILNYVDQLMKLDTEGVEPMVHVLSLNNAFRQDEIQASMERELILQNAPDHLDGYFRVPKVLDLE